MAPAKIAKGSIMVRRKGISRLTRCRKVPTERPLLIMRSKNLRDCISHTSTNKPMPTKMVGLRTRPKIWALRVGVRLKFFVTNDCFGLIFCLC